MVWLQHCHRTEISQPKNTWVRIPFI